MSCVFGVEQSCEECRMCGSKKRTNADRIRNMTNKELAESRIDSIGMYSNSRVKNAEMWTGDFPGIASSKFEALRLELQWLESEVLE